MGGEGRGGVMKGGLNYGYKMIYKKYYIQYAKTTSCERTMCMCMYKVKAIAMSY